MAKANRVAGIIFRTFRDIDIQTFLPLYKSQVRPILEYASPVWSPQLIKHKTAIEGVQRRATKRVHGLKDKSYPERLKILGLPTLEYRRLRQDMVCVYKLTKGLEDIDASELLLPETGQRTRGHSCKLHKQRTETLRTRRFFRHRVVSSWNSLPSYVIDSPSINSFKSNLNTHWKNHPAKFIQPF